MSMYEYIDWLAYEKIYFACPYTLNCIQTISKLPTEPLLE